jgi:hypothetical protein
MRDEWLDGAGKGGKEEELTAFIRIFDARDFISECLASGLTGFPSGSTLSSRYGDVVTKRTR